MLVFLYRGGETDMIQRDSDAKRFKRTSSSRRWRGIERLEARCLLAADTVIELKLDVTQDGESILDSDRRFAVEVGQRFDLELLYDDKRPFQFNENHMGAFTVYADILADNAHAYRPVLSETQIISISENLRDATEGSFVLSANGRSATIPLFGSPSLSVNPELAIKRAIEEPGGLDFGINTVTVFETLRAPRNANGDVGSGDPFEYVIRFVSDEFEFTDAANIQIDTSGIVMSADAAAPVGQVLEVPVYSDIGTQTLNPAAFLFNLDARSASLNDAIVYGNVQSGSFNPLAGDGSEVFDELGGTGPLESAGLRAVAKSVFGTSSSRYGEFLSPISNVEVFSIELEAVAAARDITFTLDRADGEKSELSAYGIDTALTSEQVLIDLVDDPSQPGDDRFGMVFGTIVDPPDVIVAPVSGLQTSESGTTQEFTISLATLPLADVVIDLSSSHPGEGTVLPSRITLTPANATTPQAITVTGIDDAIDDGDVEYTIVTSAIRSDDPFYSGWNPPDVVLRNIDDDGVGITLSKTSGIETNEAGAADTFTIVLDSQPTHAVTIPLVSSNPGEARLSVDRVTFDPANWSTPQTIVVSGVDDRVDDDDVAFTIATKPAISNDPGYSQLAAADVSGVNRDDDIAGIVFDGIDNLVVDEAGTRTGTFSIALATVPVSPVTLNLSVSDSSEASLSESWVRFTPDNGTEPIFVTVTGVDDQFDDGDIALTIVTSPSQGDPKYQGIDPLDIAVTNLDDDTAEIVVVAPGSPVTSETGAAFEFSVVLSTIPTHSVVVPVISTNTGEATVSKTSLIFTPANALTPQTVTVQGVDDDVFDGDVQVGIRLGPSVSSDGKYRFEMDEIVATNVDNELPPPETDFGDAPSPYPTMLQRDGARHFASDLFLGTAPSLERDGRPTATANGDESDDGVVFLSDLVVSDSFSTTGSLRVNASSAGRLDAWIDFNRDGDWGDPGEQIAASIALRAGDNFVPVAIPSGARPGTTFARFRISSAGGLASTGAAEDGEVEDYQVGLADGNRGADVAIRTETGQVNLDRDGENLVVSQNGNVLFAADHRLLNQLQIEATPGDDALEISNLGNADVGLGYSGGDGSDWVVLSGGNQSLDLRTPPEAFSGIESVDIVGSGPNALTLDAATVKRLAPVTNRLTLRVDNDDLPVFIGDWKLAGTAAEDGLFYRLLTFASATIRLHGGGDWTNPLLPLDVNNSGLVTAIDALQILNQLNRRDLIGGHSMLVSAASLGTEFPGKYYDTDGDGRLTPVDALRVINHLARINSPVGEAPPVVAPITTRVMQRDESRQIDPDARIDENVVDRVISSYSLDEHRRIDRQQPVPPTTDQGDSETEKEAKQIALAQWLLWRRKDFLERG